MAEPDLPSESDDSDVDFKPSDEESLPSEEDSDGSVEEPELENEEENQNSSTGKRKKKQTKRRKKIKKKHGAEDETEESKEVEETGEVKKMSAEEEKKKAESLWNDFMKDCSPPARKVASATKTQTEEAKTKEAKPLAANTTLTEKENKAVVMEIFEYAGEKIKVEREVPAQPSGRGRGRGRAKAAVGGIASIVGQLGKKNKLSTLEKSKLDWDRFKKDEGIAEDLQKHNKGKSGFLERQDFLQRTDLRQFEIEKQLRTTSRSNR